MDTSKVLGGILEEIVSHPEAVRITRIIDSQGEFIRVQVHPEDMGTVIGRGGTHSSALKLIMKLVGYKQGIKVAIKIDEPK